MFRKYLKNLVYVVSFWGAAVSMAVANPAADQFRQFVEAFSAATGQFEQYTVTGQGQTTRAQSGSFAFERPGKFRWDVEQPYAQLVVSDGRSVFQYDPDLRQATVRPVDQSIGSSPAAILFGDVALDDAFNIEALPEQDGMEWLRAIPEQPDSGLNQVDIGMFEGKPARLLLRDSFGQTTRIDLSRIRAQSSFSSDTFEFSPPTGTDVVRVQ